MCYVNDTEMTLTIKYRMRVFQLHKQRRLLKVKQEGTSENEFADLVTSFR